MPADAREPEKLVHEKKREVRRLIAEPKFPARSGRIFEYLGFETAKNDKFRASWREMYNHLNKLPLDTPTDSDVVNAAVKQPILDLWAFLKKAYRPGQKVAFRIKQRDGGKRGIGARVQFVTVRTSRRSQPLQDPQDNESHAVDFWQVMLARPEIQRVLVIYNSPANVGNDPSKLAEGNEAPGLWAGSGDVAAAFYTSSILFRLGPKVEILRWQDMQPDDLGRKYQCLLILGNSRHADLKELRKRREWRKRRGLQFIDAEGDGVLGAVADTRLSNETAGDVLREHKAGLGNGLDTDYALVFFYRDYYHDQVLVGIHGTTSAATRSAAWFMTNNDRVANLKEYLKDEKGILIGSETRGFDLLLEMTMRDGRHKTVTPVDAVAYEA